MLRVRLAPGVSKARNAGLQHVTGDVVAFPDDDCWYPPDLLERLERVLGGHQDWDGVTGRGVDEQGVTLGYFREGDSFTNVFNAWTRAITFAVFLRREVVMRVGLFDENLGPGAGTLYGSGEDTDYIIRAVKGGCRIYNCPDLIVNHPNPVLTYDHRAQSRAFRYGCGTGGVLKKHRYPLWFVGYLLFRPFGGALFSVLSGRFAKSRFHWAALEGRIRGWVS
jgi:glycosyltransferase involved in cell wall biosynthesis